MKSVLKALVVVMIVSGITVYGSTAAQWNFDNGTPGVPMAGGAGGGVVGSQDVSGNGHSYYVWDDYWGSDFSTLGDTPTGAGLSSYHAGHDDGYTLTGINSWSPQQWTIEVAVKLNDINGWKTFLGRDGASHGEAESDFYLQKNGIDGKFRVNFETVGGERYIMDSDVVAEAGKWYRLAAVSDGSTLSFYVNKLDGAGFSTVNTLALNTTNNNALAATNYNWTFGRGWYNTWYVDHITGNMDDIRFSDVALTPSQFIPEPATMILLGLGALVSLRKQKA